MSEPSAEHEFVTLLRELMDERDQYRKTAGRLGQALSDLAHGSAHVQCLVASLGELTAECGVTSKCLACMAAERVQTAQRVTRSVARMWMTFLLNGTLPDPAPDVDTALAYPDQDSSKET